jgi:hypothetical protein
MDGENLLLSKEDMESGLTTNGLAEVPRNSLQLGARHRVSLISEELGHT